MSQDLSNLYRRGYLPKVSFWYDFNRPMKPGAEARAKREERRARRKRRMRLRKLRGWH